MASTSGTGATGPVRHRATLFVDFDGASLVPGAHGPLQELSCIDGPLAYPGFGNAQSDIEIVMQTVRGALAPYDVRVFDEPPPDELPYVTAFVGGMAEQLGLDAGTRGYTCVVDCDDRVPDDASLVFEAVSGFPQPADLTGFIVLHEIGHSWGLDHEAGDTIMAPFDGLAKWSTECTNLSTATTPIGCASTHTAYCPDGQQNADAELRAMFGPYTADGDPPQLEILAPHDGDEIVGTFVWRIAIADDVPGFGWSFAIPELDYRHVARDGERELEVALPPGSYTLAVAAVDPDLNWAHAHVAIVVAEPGAGTTSTGGDESTSSSTSSTSSTSESTSAAQPPREHSGGCAIGEAGIGPILVLAGLVARRMLASVLLLGCHAAHPSAASTTSESSEGGTTTSSTSSDGDPDRDPPPARCGNGVIERDEACDLGIANGGDACRTDCSVPRCGDAIVDGGESCDGRPPACTAACRRIDEPAWELSFDLGIDTDEEIAAIGAARGLVFVTGRANHYNIETTRFSAVLEPRGELRWSSFDPLAGTFDDAADLVVIDDGFVVVGTAFPEGGGNPDAWARCYRDDGSIAWEARYDDGGELTDRGRSIARMPDGTLLFGTVRGLPLGRSDAELIAIDPMDGSELARTLLGDGSSRRSPDDLEVLADGRIVVAGVSVGTDSWGDGWVALLDAQLAVVWESTFPAMVYETNWLARAAVVGGERIVVAGVDQDGNAAWNGTIANYDALVATAGLDGARWSTEIFAGTGGREDAATVVLAHPDGGWLAFGRQHTDALQISGTYDEDAWAQRWSADGRRLEGFLHDGPTHLADAITAAAWLDESELVVGGLTMRAGTRGDAWIAIYPW